MGLVWMLVANAAAALGARALLRKVATPDDAVNLLAALVIHLVIVSVAVLAAGLAGALRADVLGLAGLAVLAILLATGETRKPSPPVRPRLGKAAAWTLAAIAAALGAQVWLMSPFGIDPLSYHLPKLSVWIREGSIHALSGADPREYFPSGFELVEIWWMVFLRHDVLIELAGVEFLALGFAATTLLASRLGIDESARPWCGIFYVLSPGIHLHATSAMNDGAVAALTVAVAALVAARSAPWLVATVILLGAGLKPTFVVSLGGFAWLAWTLRRDPAPRGFRSAAGWGGAALSALPGLYWYVRNLLRIGHPLFPPGEWAFQAMPGPLAFLIAGGKRCLTLIGPGAADALEPVNLLLVQGAGWGLVAFSIGIPALLLAVREDPAWRRTALAFLLGVVGLALLVHPAMHYLRFILFVSALLAIAAVGWAFRHPPARYALAGGGVLLFVMNLVPYDSVPGDFVKAGVIPFQSWPEGLAEAWRRNWADRGRDPRLKGIPADADVAALQGLNGWSYSLVAPDFRRRVHYLPDVADADALAAELDRLGVRWLDTRAKTSERTARAVSELLRRGGLRNVEMFLAERVR